MIDIIVVGAGASGMAAAIMAARGGASVLMLEHMEEAGKKILATGNGKCNYTNELQSADCYRGTYPQFALDVISQFDVRKTVDFFREIGIYPKVKNGYYYPFSQQASSLREALLLELERLQIKVIYGCGIRKIEAIANGFHFETKTQSYESRCCILACGGKAAKKTGSDGSGLIYGASFGHRILPLYPALVQMTAKESFYKMLAGIRAEARVDLYCNGSLIASDTGELQLTDYGISGIPVFQISRFAGPFLQEKQDVYAEIDFLPELSAQSVAELIRTRFCQLGEQRSAVKCLNGLFNQKLNPVLLQLAKIQPDTPGNRVAEKKLQQLAHLIKHFRTEITGTKSFDNAQVSAGGIDTAELTNYMESRLQPGLFFAGEMVDIDGKCGGYNLQWAWSSGAVAGKRAVAILQS